MHLITMDELHDYIKDTIIAALVDGGVVLTENRQRVDGSEYQCSMLDLPMAQSAERLRRRADMYDWTSYAEMARLPDYTRRLCDILCDEVTGREYFAWYKSGVFAGRFYRAYLSESSIDDITIQDSALAQNISVEQASAEYYNPAIGEETPKLERLIVRYIGEFFESIARDAMTHDEPIMTFKAIRNVTNL